MPIEQQVTWSPTKAGDRLVGTLVTRDEVDTPYGRKVVTEWTDVVECIANGNTIDTPTATHWPTAGVVAVIDGVRLRAGHRGGLLLKAIDGRTNVFAAVNLEPTDDTSPF